MAFYAIYYLLQFPYTNNLYFLLFQNKFASTKKRAQQQVNNSLKTVGSPLADEVRENANHTARPDEKENSSSKQSVEILLSMYFIYLLNYNGALTNVCDFRQ